MVKLLVASISLENAFFDAVFVVDRVSYIKLRLIEYYTFFIGTSTILLRRELYDAFD